MTSTETPSIAQVEQLLAENGYEVSESGSDVLKIRDLDTGISFQAALEGSVLYFSVVLTTVPSVKVTQDVMHKMLSTNNGIATSNFGILSGTDGKCVITLRNFCTLQNMGPEDQDDILSLAGYLMADLMEASELLDELTPPAGQGDDK